MLFLRSGAPALATALLAALLLAARPSAGAAPADAAPRAMTLAEALAFAASHQPTLLAARARLLAAERETGIPRGLWIPHVAGTVQGLVGTANNSTASSFTTPFLDLPRIGGTRTAPPSSWSPEPSTLAAVGVRQELFDFGRIGALQAIADSAVLAESARADADRLDVALLVEEGFFGVHAARAVLQAAVAAVERSTAHRDQAAAGVRSGLRSPIELTRAEADLSRFEVGKVRAAGGLDVAQAVFAAVVGVPEASLDAAGPLPAPAVAPAAQALQAAAEKDPFVRVAAAVQQQQRSVTRLAEAELLPELYLSAGLNGRAGGTAASGGGPGPDGSGWIPDVPNWDVGVILSWPIFDASSLARASASRARELQRSAELDAARLRFSTQAQQAAESFRVATSTLPALERAAEAASANYAQADARFKAGLGNAVELADAEALRLQGEIDLAIGRFEQARARARLARALSEAL